MLRQWTAEDIQQISEIEGRCFPKGAWTKEQIEKSFNSDGFFSVLFEDNKIQGYLGAVLNEWEAEIAFIAVDFPFRRQGIAQLMIKSLIDFAKSTKRDKIFLEVRASNLSAKSLYEKMGFKQYNLRKNYYEGTEDAVCMVFEVNGKS